MPPNPRGLPQQLQQGMRNAAFVGTEYCISGVPGRTVCSLSGPKIWKTENVNFDGTRFNFKRRVQHKETFFSPEAFFGVRHIQLLPS
jgi:hypothetical protein